MPWQNGACALIQPITILLYVRATRTSFMAGQHITSICAYDNASEFPSAVPTFAHYLRQMGYKTAYLAKCILSALTSFMDLKNVLRQMFIRQILPGRLTGNNQMSALINGTIIWISQRSRHGSDHFPN